MNQIKVIIMSEPKEEYGIYGNYISEKGAPDIMQKSQESIRDRFGYCSNDEMSDSKNY